MNEVETAEELAGTWALLEHSGRAKFRSAKTALRIGLREVQVAIDRFGARHLLIPHTTGPDQNSIWRNRSMSLSLSSLVGEDGQSDTWLVLRCKRAEVEDAFVRLCAIIARRIIDDQQADLTVQCTAVLVEWQDLFGGGSSREDFLTGLIGELLLLRRLLEMDLHQAWNAWEGPRGGRHDFRLAAHAIEVKSTLRATGRVVTINGMTQLVPPPVGSLHLVFFRLEHVLGGSITLLSLVRELSERGIPRSELLELLEDFGLSPDSQDAAFELREVRMFTVEGTFPRVVPSSFHGDAVPAGVLDVHYSIDLDHARPVDQTDEDKILRQLIHA